MLGFVILLLYTLIGGISQLSPYSIGLWPMFFCDLTIECMANAEQLQNLCCLPIQIKRKWYPLIIICIFSLLFFQLSMWVGLGIGYAYHYGLFKRFDMGIARASALEKKFPFKHAVERSYFITASMACGGQAYPGMGGFLGGGG